MDSANGGPHRERIGYGSNGLPDLDGPITLTTFGDEDYELTIDSFYGTQYTGIYTPTSVSPASTTIINTTTTPGSETVTVTESTKTNFGNLADATDLDSVALDTVGGALEEVANFRADNGAKRSRFEFASKQLTTNETNLKEANSRIVDVDVAEESTQLARANILVQAGSAMLGQANASVQIALKLVA
ncbi:flagellin [Pelagicoccus enzymogenes]|uniref:flagellin n=1 Tax=Pelagicoccus enzymogenes TaxID=2773457 RepID=UPI001CD325B1|nr:flagellin [Pelagicoccus enzymogenes]